MFSLTSLFCFFAFMIGTIEGSVIVALRQQNTDVLVKALANVSDPFSPQYGKYWTQKMIDDVVNPLKEDVDGLIHVLKDLKIDCFQRGAALECSEVPPLWPIFPLIEFVEVPANTSKPRHRVGDGSGYVGREVVNKLYNITGGHVSKASVCAVEYQGAMGYNNSDLVAQQMLNGEKPVVISPSHSIGVNEGGGMETQLDVQMMAEVAENVELWFWHEDAWVYSFAVRFLDAAVIPDVLSMSWGWSEAEQCQPGLGTCPNITSAQYVHRTNLEYVKMGLRGVSVMVASGDAGAPGRTNELCLNQGVHPVYPGSSPYVTSVGATYVVPSSFHNVSWKTPLCREYGCVEGTQELPTNYNATGWTAGGGFAIYGETQASWQKKAVEGYLSSQAQMPANFSRQGRGYPDVSVVGHNCPVMMGGSLGGVDGTSCSSPLFAAIVALLNDHQVSRKKPKLGFLNPMLYKMWEDGVFNDITQGNNWCTEEECCGPDAGFEAAEGWDPVSGLGTPNVGRMVEWLDKI